MSIQSINWYFFIVGCIIGLMCVLIIKGCFFVQNLEFFFFFNVFVVLFIRVVVEKGGFFYGIYLYENVFSFCEVCFEEVVISFDYEFFILCICWFYIVYGYCCECSV